MFGLNRILFYRQFKLFLMSKQLALQENWRPCLYCNIRNNEATNLPKILNKNVM